MVCSSFQLSACYMLVISLQQNKDNKEGILWSAMALKAVEISGVSDDPSIISLSFLSLPPCVSPFIFPNADRD